jgi:adenine-specific DNA-methyltransferase
MNQTIKFAEGLPDLHQTKLDELRKLLPNLFDKNGNLIKDELENFAQNYTQEKQEPFAFSWAGKQKAKGMAFKKSQTKLALKFDEKRSKNFDKTENLIIEGDNLHVLKLLLSSYKGKVKCIYIDPPYNTQNDFIYPDNFAESEKEYLLNSGQIDDDGDLQTDYLETAGRKHSVWLSFIYPRLVLARELLREDGVIFVSIDDNEVHHLRHLMNEVFGEEECLAQLVWRKKYGGGKGSQFFVDLHEYILVYSKNQSTLNGFSLERTEQKSKIFDLEDEFILTRGKHYVRPLKSGLALRKTLIYPIKCPDDSKIETQWICAKDTFEKWKEEGRIVFKKQESGKYSVYKKFYEKDGGGLILPESIMFDLTYNQSGKEELKKLFQIKEGRETYFDNPKPVDLIKHFLQISTQPNDIILDFFAGSGTTAQAVMELNQEEIDKKSKDGFLTNEEKETGGRKFILVQLPEKINQKKSSEAYKFVADLMQKRGDENKPPVISEITIERVRRASEKYKLVDAGFKVMTVSESAINRKLMNQITASKEEIFAEIALFYGYGLNYKYRQLHNLGKGVSYLCGNNREALIILGEEQLENETLKEIILASDGLSQCQIFAQDACLDVEIIHNLYQHFEQRKVVIL